MYSLRKDLARRLGLKEEHILEDEFEREVRRRYADWEFIERQPPRVRGALKLYVETGDLRLAQRLSGMPLEDFYELVKKARIPIVIVRRGSK